MQAYDLCEMYVVGRQGLEPGISEAEIQEKSALQSRCHSTFRRVPDR